MPATSVAQLPRRSVTLAFLAAYVVAVTLSEHAYGRLAVPSPFWLPDSVLLCALLISPRKEWWFFLAAIWPVRLLVGAVPGTPLWFQMVSIANDAAKAVAAAWLIQRATGRDTRLETLRELLVFFGIAGATMPLLSAAAAAPARYALGDSVWSATYNWFLGDALAQIVVTPTLLYWCRRSYRHPRARLRELLVLSGGLAVASTYAFVTRVDAAHSLALLYLPGPFLVYAAVRLRPFGTANAVSLVAVISIVVASRGAGIFAAGPSVLSLQAFLLILNVSLLTLAVVIEERIVLMTRERKFNRLLSRAQEDERARIARELHDDFTQQLALLKLDLHQLAGAVTGQPAAIAAAAARRADDLAMGLHDLSRRLHPARLRLLGLAATVKGLLDEVSLSHGSPRITFTQNNVPESLPDDLSVTLFRIVQEALTNAIKHGRARHITVELNGDLDRLVLRVVDDGVGFVVNTSGDGLGLVSMGERVKAIGGTLKVESTPFGGTRLDVNVPLWSGSSTDTVMA